MRSVVLILTAAFVVSCGGGANTNTTGSNNQANTQKTPLAPPLPVVDRPQKVKDLMAARGEQDSAAPTLKIVEPAAGSTVNGSTVKVKLELSGDLKGYKPGMDEATHTGNHIHVILDNQPYEAYYNLGKPFELRNVADGEHLLRVFPSRPWHESYKNEGAFQMVRFNVTKGGADANKPTTTGDGQKVANAASTSEGKDMQPTTAGVIDEKLPLITYSRPKGEYKGEDTNAIMIDFWLSNAKLLRDGGEYRVRYTVDGGEPQVIDKWEPVWLSGWTPGKHTVELQLIDKAGNIVVNGGYNPAARDITITK